MKISQEAREAAHSLGPQGYLYEKDIQRIINSTLEKAALEIEQFGELDGPFLADVIRQLIEE